MKKLKRFVCISLTLVSLSAFSALTVLANNVTAETMSATKNVNSVAPRAQLAYGWGLYPKGISAKAHSRSFLLGSPDTPLNIDSIGVKIVSTRTNGTTKTVSNTSNSASYCEVSLVEEYGTSIDNYTSTHTFKSYMGTTVETVTKGPNDD